MVAARLSNPTDCVAAASGSYHALFHSRLRRSQPHRTVLADIIKVDQFVERSANRCCCDRTVEWLLFYRPIFGID